MSENSSTFDAKPVAEAEKATRTTGLPSGAHVTRTKQRDGSTLTKVDTVPSGYVVTVAPKRRRQRAVGRPAPAPVVRQHRPTIGSPSGHRPPQRPAARPLRTLPASRAR